MARPQGSASYGRTAAARPASAINFYKRTRNQCSVTCDSERRVTAWVNASSATWVNPCSASSCISYNKVYITRATRLSMSCKQTGALVPRPFGRVQRDSGNARRAGHGHAVFVDEGLHMHQLVGAVQAIHLAQTAPENSTMPPWLYRLFECASRAEEFIAGLCLGHAQVPQLLFHLAHKRLGSQKIRIHIARCG
jgi:hypothetical protein